MLKFRARIATYIKKQTVQSSKLLPGQKKYYPVGSNISIKQVIKEEDGHLLVELSYGQGQWYLFMDHWGMADAHEALEVEEATKFIAKHEGLRLEAYPDPLHGWRVPTIGLGTTVYPSGEKVSRGDKITRDEAFKYAENFVKKELTPKLRKIPKWNCMNINQKVALYGFGYNLGASFYGRSDFKSITNLCDSPSRWKDKDWVKEQFVKYRNPGSNVEAGLRRRRLDEARLFCSPVKMSSALPPIPSNPNIFSGLNLSGSVGANGQNLQKDVSSVRRKFRELGYNIGLSESSVDNSLIQAIKLFQSIINGHTRLSGDGRIDVGHSTHQWLNSPNAPRWVTMSRTSEGMINVEALEAWDFHDYGTDWIDDFLKEIASEYEREYRRGRDNVSLIQVNDVSYRHGGDTPDHFGHETGMCADLRLPSTAGGSRTIVQTWRSPDYHRTACLEQLKLIKGHPLTKVVYFNDPQAINLGLCQRASGHDTHIHISIKPKKM